MLILDPRASIAEFKNYGQPDGRPTACPWATEIGPQLPARCGALTDQNELIPSYKRLKLFEEYSKNLSCQVSTAITAPQFGAIK
jgi:hypothetical protein